MAAIESPCKKICVIDRSSALCVGCGRTLAEIEGWIRFSAGQRTRIVAELAGRLAVLARFQTSPRTDPD